MHDKPISHDLLSRIKDGLLKSGFPLELGIAKVIEDNGWHYSIASQYLDFETKKLRESDIVAEKEINGIQVFLFIECKKSDEKQLILYQPNRDFQYLHSLQWLKYFPDIEDDGEGIAYEFISEEFDRMPTVAKKNNSSKGIIFTKGNLIEQNNTSFFSSVNSLVKRGIVNYSRESSYSKNFRRFYLYIIVYDGYILKLSRGDNNDFDLTEVNYGQYLTNIRFNIPDEPSLIDSESINVFGNEFIFEIMKPNYLPDYLREVEDFLLNINKNNLKGWGEDYELPF